MIRLAKERGIRIVLLTQPAIWSDGAESAHADLLWMGHSPTALFYSEAALARGLALYNAALLRVAQRENVPVVDLASAMNGDAAYFYDDMHFNEAGARRVAELAAPELGKP